MNIVTRGVGALAVVSALSLALVAAVARSGAPLAPTAIAGDIVIRKVSVVDTATGHISSNRDVVVRGGKIVGVVPAAPAYPSSVRAIDGAGKFVVPGYNDMHAHSLDPNPRDRLDNLTLMLANGITGFRQMSGTPKLLEERREGKLLSFADAPAVLSMPGQILMPLNAPTPAAAIAEVDRQKADGADFIKVVDVDAATFFAVGAEAKKLGLTFGGHLPDRVDALQASAAGFHFIEHMGPWSTILVSCSTDEQAIRKVVAERPARTFGGSGNGESLPPEMLKGNGIVDLVNAGSRWGTILEIAGAGRAAVSELAEVVARRRPVLALTDVKLLAPIERPGKYLAIGMNYAQHLEEADKLGIARAKHQTWFNKQTSCIAGPYDDIDPGVTEKLDYEVELGAVIGCPAKSVSEADAPDHVFGYFVANDVSARDWQFHTPTFTMGKSFDTHGPIGPWIVTADEVEDPHNLTLRSWVNGERRQENNTGNMIHNLWKQIAYLSTAFTLETGDLIATGTPEGVGVGMEPPLFLKAGDVVRCEVEGIGVIENRVATCLRGEGRWPS